MYIYFLKNNIIFNNNGSLLIRFLTHVLIILYWNTKHRPDPVISTSIRSFRPGRGGFYPLLKFLYPNCLVQPLISSAPNVPLPHFQFMCTGVHQMYATMWCTLAESWADHGHIEYNISNQISLYILTWFLFYIWGCTLYISYRAFYFGTAPGSVHIIHFICVYITFRCDFGLTMHLHV